MENKNITFNYTLEQYNKKYRNRRHRLLRYTKKQVEEFDKQYGHYVFNGKTHNLEFNHYILKNRKWVLIGDTYYEIPKPVRLTWFRNLSVGVQATISALGIVGVTSAIVFPTLAVTVWNNRGSEIVLTIDPSGRFYSSGAVNFNKGTTYNFKIDCSKFDEQYRYSTSPNFMILTEHDEKTFDYAKNFTFKTNLHDFSRGADDLEDPDKYKYSYCNNQHENLISIGGKSFSEDEKFLIGSFVATTTVSNVNVVLIIRG